MTRAINDDYLMTHSEIAEVMGITRTRVLQLEKSALRKLRDRFILRQYYRDYVSSSSESRTQDRVPYV
jgi:DNA-directed RNA polymerase sigma subunit (sigma70/sigma32)